MSGFFMAAGAAANVAQEVPIDGQTGVWIKSGTAVVSSAMKMTGVVVSSGWTQYVYNKGVIVSNILRAGVVQEIHSGGVESGTSDAWGNGASATIFSGGTSYDRSVKTYLKISAGAVVSNITGLGGFIIANSATLHSATASGTAQWRFTGGAKVYDWYIAANMTSGYAISSGTLVSGMSGVAATVNFPFSHYAGLSNAVCESGWTLTFGSHGSAGGVTLKSGAAIVVSNTGVVSAVTVSGGGALTVSSGGTALAVTSSAGVEVTVDEGGYIEYVTP